MIIYGCWTWCHIKVICRYCFRILFWFSADQSIPNSLLCPCVFRILFFNIFAILVAILACSALLDEIFSCFFYLVLLVMLSRHQFFLVIFLLAVKVRWLNYVWKIQLTITYLTLTVCLSIALLFYLLCFATLVATLLCLMQYWQALLHLM